MNKHELAEQYADSIVSRGHDMHRSTELSFKAGFDACLTELSKGGGYSEAEYRAKLEIANAKTLRYDELHRAYQVRGTELTGALMALDSNIKTREELQQKIAQLESESDYLTEVQALKAESEKKDQRIAELELWYKTANQISEHNYEKSSERIEQLEKALREAHAAMVKVEKFGYGVSIEKNFVITNTQDLMIKAANGLAEALKEKG